MQPAGCHVRGLYNGGCWRDYSARSKPYRYESSTRHTCSGAEVYEPELKKEIRICNPQGNVYSDTTLYVEKRSNATGIVVLWAITRA